MRKKPSLKMLPVPLLCGWAAGGLLSAAEPGLAPQNLPAPPTQIATRSGDRSAVLHWDPLPQAGLRGYYVYRGDSATGSFTKIGSGLVARPSYADLTVRNGQTYFYFARSVNQAGESLNSETVSVTPKAFANDGEFLEYAQQTAFDYFWYEANPSNGLVRDRSTASSPCSIAAAGFGLTGIGIAIDHGWIMRAQGRARALTTLQTFSEKPQGPAASGIIGYKGWFYHFLDMDTGWRTWQSELSSIDTALLLAGILYVRQYFDRDQPEETQIRALAKQIFDRVDWNWMANGGQGLTMGWKPETGFLTSRWIGYNEAMLLYLLAFGAASNALPSAHWQTWTSGYQWRTNYGYSYVQFEPLFGHQYSHCWIDFRHLSDDYMSRKGITYFENSRRATLAQRAYAIANPKAFPGYGPNLWGFTACDGPGAAGYLGYSARGAPPPLNDDGTVAPTAPGGSMAFAPEYALPALRFIYDQYRAKVWTGYGFRDAFNLQADWWDPDVLGIDQGPILIMAENYRTRGVWNTFMKNEEAQRGLTQAGFKRGAFAAPTLEHVPAAKSFTLNWIGEAGRAYQVEYSPDLGDWTFSPTGFFPVPTAASALRWIDHGPPATVQSPVDVPRRFYRVYQLASP